MAYVVNVDTWGSSPSYSRGQIVPEDCPYDVEEAAEKGTIVTEAEYKRQHPDWDPEEQEKRDAIRREFPGRDLPTAADPPDIEVVREESRRLRGELVEERPDRPSPDEPPPAPSEPAEQPIPVQQPSNPTAPPGSTSTRRSGS